MFGFCTPGNITLIFEGLIPTLIARFFVNSELEITKLALFKDFNILLLIKLPSV